MKTINHFLESFAIAVILAVSSYIVVTKGTILWLQALTLVALLILVIVYTKLSINHEKHLEAKFEMIHLSYTNCLNSYNDLRKRYNEVEKQRNEWKEKYEKLDFERRYEEKIPDGTSTEEIPFNIDNDLKEEVYVCPQCGEEMTRYTSKIAFCDNPSCNRKQWRIDKLEG